MQTFHHTLPVRSLLEIACGKFSAWYALCGRKLSFVFVPNCHTPACGIFHSGYGILFSKRAQNTKKQREILHY